MQAAILARFLSEGGVLDLHPDPRPCLDMTKNTPYETAVQHGHCTPFIMEALNSLTPAIELHRLCNKQLEQATAVQVAPPAKQPDLPTRMLAIGERHIPGKVMVLFTPLAVASCHVRLGITSIAALVLHHVQVDQHGQIALTQAPAPVALTSAAARLTQIATAATHQMSPVSRRALHQHPPSASPLSSQGGRHRHYLHHHSSQLHPGKPGRSLSLSPLPQTSSCRCCC
jgi:hypothetical protein